MGTTATTSPRLPSPPPFTEVQISPTAPTTSPPAAASQKPTTTRRIRPGTKNSQITAGPPLIPLSELDSAFQLQEHLAALLCSITSPTISDTTTALNRDSCQTLSTPPDGVEESLWCYELTRRLTRDLNVLVVALLNDKCTASSCPEMRASEWQYLCAVHDPPQSCCAIDYSTHTLDQAATMLCSTRYFPSRLSLQASSIKHLGSIFRRLYRIFAHAWFQHRTVFWEVEGEFGLYLFFKTVSDRYHLIPEDNLTIPPEAEGLKAPDPDFLHSDDEDEIDEFDRGTGSHGELGDFLDDHEEEDDEDYPSDEDSDPENDGEDAEGDLDRDEEEFELEEFDGSDGYEVRDVLELNEEIREIRVEEERKDVKEGGLHLSEGEKEKGKGKEDEKDETDEKRGDREGSVSPEPKEEQSSPQRRTESPAKDLLKEEFIHPKTDEQKDKEENLSPPS